MARPVSCPGGGGADSVSRRNAGTSEEEIRDWIVGELSSWVMISLDTTAG